MESAPVCNPADTCAWSQIAQVHRRAEPIMLSFWLPVNDCVLARIGPNIAPIRSLIFDETASQVWSEESTIAKRKRERETVHKTGAYKVCNPKPNEWGNLFCVVCVVRFYIFHLANKTEAIDRFGPQCKSRESPKRVNARALWTKSAERNGERERALPVAEIPTRAKSIAVSGGKSSAPIPLASSSKDIYGWRSHASKGLDAHNAFRLKVRI